MIDDATCLLAEGLDGHGDGISTWPVVMASPRVPIASPLLHPLRARPGNALKDEQDRAQAVRQTGIASRPVAGKQSGGPLAIGSNFSSWTVKMRHEPGMKTPSTGIFAAH